ncbi:MAG: universal stress protein, partial [Deltaproteobacteria bacterium]|nr:universal stress protein [Deltaproteobacteria bacterium]
TGSRGTGNIEELLLGSVSYKVVRKIKKPILVIK